MLFDYPHLEAHAIALTAADGQPCVPVRGGFGCPRSQWNADTAWLPSGPAGGSRHVDPITRGCDSILLCGLWDDWSLVGRDEQSSEDEWVGVVGWEAMRTDSSGYIAQTSRHALVATV